MIFAKNFARNYFKKIILGTSNAWMTNHLFQHIIDCRIFDYNNIQFPFELEFYLRIYFTPLMH